MTLPVADVADVLLDPWRSGISGRALVEVALLGLAAGPLGCWVVLYGLSYSAESLAHALFPGLVIAALAGFPLVLGAALGAIVAAPAIAYAGPAARDSAATPRSPSWSPRCVGAGALLALSPDIARGRAGAAVRRRARASRAATWCWRRPWPQACSPRCGSPTDAA